MSLMKWLSSLLPRMDKDKILDDCRITSKELTTGVIPSYDEAVKYLGMKSFKSKKLNELSNIFYRNSDLSGRKSANFITDIQKNLINVKNSLDYAEANISKILEKDVITDGLTAQKAILVRACEHISFITSFAIDLLAYVYSMESLETLGKKATEEEQEIYGASKFQIKTVEDKFLTFVKIFDMYAISDKDLQAKFKAIPDVVINARNYDVVSSTFEKDKVDPIMGGALLMGFENNPIYHFRLMFAEWQAQRYNCNKEKVRSLQLRLLMLQELDKGNKDPSVQKEVEYIQSRIDTISYRINKELASVS